MGSTWNFRIQRGFIEKSITASFINNIESWASLCMLDKRKVDMVHKEKEFDGTKLELSLKIYYGDIMKASDNNFYIIIPKFIMPDI